MMHETQPQVLYNVSPRLVFRGLFPWHSPQGFEIVRLFFRSFLQNYIGPKNRKLYAYS